MTVVEVPQPRERTQPPVAVPDTISARIGDVVDIARARQRRASRRAAAHARARSRSRSPTRACSSRPATGCATSRPTSRASSRRPTASTAPTGSSPPPRCTSRCARPTPRPTPRPVPPTITARVIAGETVRIPIPLGGTDPDGDSVQLLGQESNPERGTVVATRRRLARLRGGRVLGGYRHVPVLGGRRARRACDRHGPRRHRARGSTARRAPIAVAGRRHRAPGPHDLGAGARERLRPRRRRARPALDVEPNGTDATAAVVGDDHRGRGARRGEGDVRVHLRRSRTSALGSGVELPHGRRARRCAARAARGVRHRAQPQRHPRSRTSSTSTVLRNVFLADGDAADLRGRARRRVTTAAPRCVATARIRVDGRGPSSDHPVPVTPPRGSDDHGVRLHLGARPRRRAAAAAHATRRGSRVRQRRGGRARPRRLRDRGIRAAGAHHRCRDACVPRTATAPTSSSTTTRCASAARRGTSDRRRSRSRSPTASPPTDPAGRTGTIVIPIDVRPTEDQPPVFIGGVIDFEPGQSKTIDLVKLTNYPYPDDDRRARVPRAAARSRRASRSTLDGQRAHHPAAEATSHRHAQAVRSRSRTPTTGEGRPAASSCGSCRRPARSPQPAADIAVVARGTHDHDRRARERQADEPVPRDAAARRRRARASTTSLPDGVSIEPSGDRSDPRRSTVAPDAAPVNTTLQYQVADATDDPSRYAWGTVTISVQDRPDPVTGAPGHRIRRRHARRRVRRRRVQQLADHRLRDRAASTPSRGDVLDHVDVRGDDVHGADAGQRPGQRRARAGAGPQRDRALRPRRRARADLVRRRSRRRPQGAARAAARRPAPHRVGAGRHRRRAALSQSYVVTVGGVSSEVVGRGCVHRDACARPTRRRIENGSQVPFTVSARNEAYPALADVDRGRRRPARRSGRRSRAASRSPATPRPARSRCPGRRSTATATRSAATSCSASPTGDARADRAAGVLGHDARARATVVAPASGGTVAEVVRVGPDASSVQFTGTVDGVDAGTPSSSGVTTGPACVEHRGRRHGRAARHPAPSPGSRAAWTG